MEKSRRGIGFTMVAAMLFGLVAQAVVAQQPAPGLNKNKATPAAHGNTLLAEWNFDEVSAAGEVRDTSGNEHHAQLFRGSLVKGRKGKGLRLAGNSGGYAVTRLMADDLGGDFTIAQWIKVEGPPREAGIISFLGHRTSGFCLRMKDLQLGTYSGTYGPTVAVTDTQWHHVAVAHARVAGKTRLFLDGKQVADASQQVLTVAGVPLTIGRFYADFNGFYFQGILDEVRVYGTALDAAGVEEDRARGAAGPTPPSDEQQAAAFNLDPGEWLKSLPCHWEQVTDNAGWSPRDSCGEMVYDKKMWLLGGWYDSSTPGLCDVWSSANGVTWTQATAVAPWKHSDLPTTMTFAGKMWIMGGWYGGRLPDASASDQVWSSTNGSDWKLVTDHAGWSSRCGAAGVVFKGRMWIMGGVERYLDGNEIHRKNDVWSSADGKSWECATAAAPWPPRSCHAAVVFKDRIWLFGGGNYLPAYQAFNDVWNSADGVHWEKVTDHAPWSPRLWFSSVVFRDRMWVLGGWSNEPSKNWNDVWHTADGVHWKKLEVAWPSMAWAPRHEQSAYVFEDTIWIAGGNAYPLVNDVWRLHVSEEWLKMESRTQANPP
jgi:hypothetical protein